MPGKYWMISELKLYDYLKKDGQNCCALLLGLRNDYYLYEKRSVPNTDKLLRLRIFS